MQKVPGEIVGDPIPSEDLGLATENMILSLGWQDSVRSVRIFDELAITTIDVVPEKDVAFRAAGPATFSIFLCLSGRGSVQVDGGAPYDIQPGHAILFACDRYSSGWNRMHGGERLTLIDLRYEKQFLKRAGGRQLEQFSTSLLNAHCVPEDGAYMVGFPMVPELARCASDIIGCTRESGAGRDLYLQAKALEALAHVVDFSGRACVFTDVLSSWEKRKLTEARKLLENEFEKAWTIPLLAREVGLNEKKLKAGFRQFIGNTIRRYHQEVRVEAATTMLKKGSTVTEAAYSTGFTSLSHFSKLFRERTGLKPSEFARRA